MDIAEKHDELKVEIQDMIASFQLYPVLRVEYDRIAFQPKDHDHVRVSIDINMRYLQEKTSHLDWYSFMLSRSLTYDYSLTHGYTHVTNYSSILVHSSLLVH